MIFNDWEKINNNYIKKCDDYYFLLRVNHNLSPIELQKWRVEVNNTTSNYYEFCKLMENKFIQIYKDHYCFNEIEQAKANIDEFIEKISKLKLFF